jgi:hypothetical protein
MIKDATVNLPRDPADRCFERRRRRPKLRIDYHASRSAVQHLNATGGGSCRPPPDFVALVISPLSISDVLIPKNSCRIIEANVLYRMCETCVQSSIDQIGHDVRVIAVNAAISH